MSDHQKDASGYAYWSRSYHRPQMPAGPVMNADDYTNLKSIVEVTDNLLYEAEKEVSALRQLLFNAEARLTVSREHQAEAAENLRQWYVMMQMTPKGES